MEKLPEDFKAKWIAELRSGKHKQGRGIMYNHVSDELCCLAVAGVVCGMDKYVFSGIDILIGANYLSEYSSTPKAEVSKIAVKDFSYPEILTGNGLGLAQKLAEMNDNGQSFSEIADWIEANL